MPIPDYRNFQHSTELYHYGMPRRSGRYPWGSGERPYQSREERRAERAEKRVDRAERRLTKRLDRIDKKVERAQSNANKYYEKGLRKENKLIQTRFSRNAAEKAYAKANTSQERASMATYKGAKYFQKYKKLVDKLDFEMDDDLKRRGMEYLNSAIANSKGSYERFDIVGRLQAD